MTEMERTLERMGNVKARLESCKSEWARRHWTLVLEQLRRQMSLAEMHDQGLFAESQIPNDAVLAPRGLYA